MPLTPSRERLARIVRGDRCDLAEAALLCCVEVEPDLDVEVELLRIDALADALITSGFEAGSEEEAARGLAAYLGGRLGFSGDRDTYHDPRNSLLTRVLDRRRGLPITLSIVYIAIAQRAGVDAFGINTPGHFLVGVGDDPTVLDPFDDGALLDVPQIADRVNATTAGLVEFHADMLRPAPAATIIRRLLDNLTRDFLSQGDAEDALWTVELKRLLPGSAEPDIRAAAELLVQLGRYRDAAQTVEAFAAADPAAADDELVRLGRRARAKMN